jgi:hypothetical protein
MSPLALIDTGTGVTFDLTSEASKSLANLLSSPIISSAAAKFFGVPYANLTHRVQYIDIIAQKVAKEMLDEKLYDADCIGVSMEYK